MTSRPRLLFAFVLVAFAVLVALGTWQVQRLHWKQGLIARIADRSKAPPVPFIEVLTKNTVPGDLEYLPVQVEGRLLAGPELDLFALDGNGKPGWQIHRLLQLSGAEVIGHHTLIVNLGFVPLELKESESWRAKLQPGPVAFSGILRLLPERRPPFAPDNDAAGNSWYWLTLAAVRARLPKEQAEGLLPYWLDRAPQPGQAGWPRSGVSRLDLPNRHLEYVFTWYGLALALITVYAFFLYGSRRRKDEDQG